MTKDKLIEKWNEKHSKLLLDYNTYNKLNELNWKADVQRPKQGV